METTLIALVVGALNVVCFYFGAKVGMSVVKDEPIQLPSFNPFQAYREHENKKEAEREQEKIDTILQNIDAYDGTGANQKDVM
jgi:hypothetical protein